MLKQIIADTEEELEDVYATFNDRATIFVIDNSNPTIK